MVVSRGDKFVVSLYQPSQQGSVGQPGRDIGLCSLYRFVGSKGESFLHAARILHASCTRPAHFLARILASALASLLARASSPKHPGANTVS